jgi:hypothetical protein
MTFPDPRLERPLERHGTPLDNAQDVIAPSGRNQDPGRTDLEHGLTLDNSRPLTDDEKKAADRDAPVGERVYAPASERVPVDPVPGHRDFVEHPDTRTPERQAVGPVSMTAEEPSFTRVARPSSAHNGDTSPAGGGYASPISNSGDQWDNDPHTSRGWGAERRRRMFFGLGFSWLSVIGCGVGAWLFMRWQRERNKPINRLRRQAKQAAAEVRGRMPSPEEAARPAMGLTTALLSIAVLLWQQTQSRSRSASKDMRSARKEMRSASKDMRRRASKTARKADSAVSRAAEAVSDVDWQNRLMALRKRWHPARLELEKISISRH